MRIPWRLQAPRLPLGTAARQAIRGKGPIVSGSQTRRARSAWFWLILTLAGCHAVGDPPPPALVDRAVEERTGYTLCGAACGSEVFLPPGVSLDDGLTEDEAIRTALCNNALFQELL